MPAKSPTRQSRRRRKAKRRSNGKTRKGPKLLQTALDDRDRQAKLRGTTRWNRRRLAKVVGVSPPTVTRWLNGERVPDRPHMRKLFELFGIPPGAWV